jgi:hypothetical protein
MKKETKEGNAFGPMMFHGWLGVTLWMAFGLLAESLMAYKSPAYLADAQRRELFRLAHAHGALLHLVLVVAALYGTLDRSSVARAARTALRTGAVVMPAGFLLAGIWHPEGDPGHAIWLVPLGAVMVILGGFTMALGAYRSRKR